MTYATKLSSDECKRLLSDVKLGVDLGIIKELDDSKVQKIGIIYKSRKFTKIFWKSNVMAIEREIKRAEVVKQDMSNS